MIDIALTITNASLFSLALIALYPAVSWLERRSALAAEERERVGRRPLLPLARTLKLLSKRSGAPPRADMPLHILAPWLGLGCSVLALSLLPLTMSTRGAVAPGGTLPMVLGLFLCTTWTVAVGATAGGNRLALLGGLRLASLRGGTLIAAALGFVAISRQLGTLSLAGLVHAQSEPAFAFLPGKGLPAWGFVESPLGAGIALVALAVLSQRMSPTRPDIALDLVDGYAAAAAGPTLLVHRGFEILELLAHGAIIATLLLGGWAIPFVDWNGSWGEPSSFMLWSRGAVFIGKALLGCLMILVMRRLLPPLSVAQATRLAWIVLVPLAGLALLFPRDLITRLPF